MSMFARARIRVSAVIAGMQDRFAELRVAEEGQALVEYGLVLALIAVVAVVALQALGVNVVGGLNKAIDTLK